MVSLPPSESTLISSSGNSRNFSTSELGNSAKNGIDTLFKTFRYKTHTLQFMQGKTPYVYTCEHPDIALKKCIEFNEKGYDVYFMVNEGDGVTKGSGKTVRNKEAIVNLSKLYVDLDGCPLDKLLLFLTESGIAPHLIVQTSDEDTPHYHAYIDIEPVPLTELYRWKTVQQMLARLGDPEANPKSLGLDRTMVDESKVLRVPGFYHVKKEFLVRTIKESNHAAYTLDYIYDAIDAIRYVRYLKDTYGTYGPTYTPPETIESGSRFESFQAYAMYVANKDLSDTDKFNLFKSKVILDTDHADDEYVVGATLSHKALDIFNSAITKVRREKEVLQQIQIAEQVKIAADANSDLYFPDEFYLSAPNGFGEVVRQGMKSCFYAHAPLIFGSLIAGASIVKAKQFYTPNGNSPALYILNIGISGLGKNGPLVCLKNTLEHYGLTRLIESTIRSDRGLLDHVCDNDSSGIFISDEIAKVIESIQNPKSSPHIKNVERHLLMLSTAQKESSISLGRVSSNGKKPGEAKARYLRYPVLAVSGYMVPEDFLTIFNVTSVASGLLSRFIPIFAPSQDVLENYEADFGEAVLSPFFELPPDFASTVPEIEGGQIKMRPRMEYTPEAQEFYRAMVRKYRKEFIDSANGRGPVPPEIASLISRIMEMSERLASVLSPGGIITLETIEYATKFSYTINNALIKRSAVGLGGGSPRAREECLIEDRVFDAIIKLLSDSGQISVPYGVVSEKIRYYVGDRYKIERVLLNLERGEKIRIESPEKGGRGRKSRLIFLGKSPEN